ncbi:MAG: hypothetical protein ABII88_09755 [Candidatus Omnitrophota bacterium]
MSLTCDEINNLAMTLIPIISIILTTLVAIFSIRKTAESNRVSTVHTEMLKCLIDSIVIIRKISILLDDIARKVTYVELPEEKTIETAHTRYWREINNLTSEFNLLNSKQKLLFPKNIYDKMQEIIDELNKGRNLSKDLVPSNNLDTTDLNKVTKKINSLYVDFIHEARNYVGVDALKPVTMRKEYILGAEKDKDS